MIIAFPSDRLQPAAPRQGTAKAMNLFLHIGAHRCATTSFQDYLRQNATRLAVDGVGYWGPLRTRGKLFAGIIPGAGDALRRNRQSRAQGRVQIALARAVGTGVQNLIVSDENMMGSVRANLRLGGLYDGVGERLARFNEAFGGSVTHVALSIRALDSYWASAIGYSLTRGRGVSNPGECTRLANSPRSWRDVIMDVVSAMPDAKITVLPFETFAGRPDAQLQAMTNMKTPRDRVGIWSNATPHLQVLRDIAPAGQAAFLPAGNGRWQPFSQRQQATLRERYQDDIMWLNAGADGLATLAQDPDKKMAGLTPTNLNTTRGRPYDDEERRLAGAG
ncbi:MAG: hypothetical protein ACU0BB_17320 [Paracoccaceae bacterium]